MITLIAIILASYILGSFPSSLVCSKLFKGIDIREYGSGNAGGTNSFRVLGWKIGLLVTFIDIGKGAFATSFLSQLQIGPEISPLTSFQCQILAGSCAIIGHVWSVFASFRGGKGVATAAGMLSVLFPWSFLTILTLFLLIAATTRYVSLASMTALSSFPLVGLMYTRWGLENVPSEFISLSLALALLVIFTHRENVKRLLAGKENKFHGYDPQSTQKKLSSSQKLD